MSRPTTKTYNPAIHHRRSIRLKGYDYSQAGLYFVTICVQNRQCLFGKITDGEMVLNDAGKMIKKWCAELSHKFPDIIRNDNSYQNIANYIANNPAKWQSDKFCTE